MGTGRVLSRTNAISMGYVPDGLSKAQYEALQKKEAKARADNKKKSMKGSKETLTEWFERSTKKYPNQPGKGHIFFKIRGGEKGEGGAKDDPRAAANMK